MLNWIMAVSGAVSNLPSAPTKTVLGWAVRVGVWAIANAANAKTAARIRTVDFIVFSGVSVIHRHKWNADGRRGCALWIVTDPGGYRETRGTRVSTMGQWDGTCNGWSRRTSRVVPFSRR